MNKKVLIADDEPHILRSLGFVIRRAGYDVMEARSGDEALSMIQQEHPGLAFLDIMMPGMDGYEVCRRVKESAELSAMEVILLTAKGEVNDREMGLAAGADDYVTKPFSPSRVVAQVEAALGPAEN